MDANNIIQRILKGDGSAMEEIYLLYRDEFSIWIMRQQKLSDLDTKDIFQETVITFYENVRKGKIEELTSQLKTYLFGIGRNKAREWKRKNPSNTDEPNLDVLGELIVQSGVAKKEELEEKIVLLYSAMRLLGEPCKSLLELFHFQGMSMDDIAILNGYSGRNSVKTQRYKCFARLRKIYIEEYKQVG